ncbi:PapD-like protein [Chytriomyces sp. MP71]|nr:PapD-like protein [Chytriomyces sp. MP71]
MTLEVTPDSNLDFRRPFNQVVRQTINLRNVATDGTILAFKIKTTAPKQYCVRPNAGTILAGASREVEVLLQAMKEDPPLDYKCKDKFLVQSIAAPSDVASLEGEALAARLAELWTRADELKKSGMDPVIEKKLKCNFVGGEGAMAALDAREKPPVPGSTVKASAGSPEYATAANGTIAAANAGPALVDRELRDAKDAIKRLTQACEGYKSEIERLNALRQRRVNDDKSGGAVAGAGTTLAPAPVGAALPLPLALVLAIIAFILGSIIF